MATYQPLFFSAVDRTGVAVGTIVAIGTAPVLAGALGVAVRGERPGARWAGATVLAVAGSALLLGQGERIDVDPGGVLLAVGAGLSYATFAVASKGLLARAAPIPAMAVVFALGALLLSPLLATQPLGWLAAPRGAAVALHLGLLATAAAYVLFARGLAAIPVATAATLSLAEPLTAGLLGVFLLDEGTTGSAALGIALLLGGLVFLATARRPGGPAAT